MEATKFVLEPIVDTEKLRKGLSGNIRISLSHPECKTVIIPLNVLAEFNISPPRLIVLNAEPLKPVTRQVWILNNYNRDFEIESISSKEGIIRVLSQEKNENRYRFELEITPPATKNKRRFTDVFFVNIKDGRKLIINCQGFYSKKKSL